MRSLRAALVVLTAASLVAPGCAAHRPDVLGRSVTLVPREKKAEKVTGELLAVEEDRLWVRTEEGVRELEAGAFREARVRRHGQDGRWAIRWGLLGGLASGAVLTGACSSVEGNGAGGCAAVGALSAALWTLVGFLSAPSLEASSQIVVDPQGDDRLKPYSRFPAGVPKGVTPQSLAGPPDPR